jgi:type IV pilus assembly protein PilA
MKNMQKGFTLIELMIVVAIIAILAAIAIPAYQDYIVRSQFTESQTIADGLKTPIQEFAAQSGACPTNGQAGSAVLPAGSYLGKYVATATTGGPTSGTTGTGCTITVTFKNTAGSVSAPLMGASAVFTATNSGGAFNWACTSTVANKYKPQACRN